MTLKQALWEIVRDENIIITNQNIDWLLDRALRKASGDAQALKESVLERKENGELIPLLPKQSEWISVEDRLPTEGQNVLCYENGNYYIAFYENMDNVISWWDWVDFDRDDTWNEVCPTHWMPLPEAPKMKGGEE